MADVRLEGVAHSYDGGRTWALQPITMTWRNARAYALLGPSGCGKTTLLNIMSGLLRPTTGRIWFGDREVTTVPTAGRNIAQVFQFPVLYEGMTVYDNLAFPLRNRGYPRADVDQRVRRVSELLGLDSELRRRARRLDPGRRQIVSLGRGLVRPDVAAVLLDEPLTVVDPALRWTMRSTLKQIHRDTGHTLVYVTHDQTEALTFADEVVVLQDGAVVQLGEPTELFLSPTHEFVGHFIGSPGMNMLDGEIVDGAVHLGDAVIGRAVPEPATTATAEATEMENEAEDETRPEMLASGPVRIGVRPEFVELVSAPRLPGVSARVAELDRMGAYDLVGAPVAGGRVVARVAAGSAGEPGEIQHFGFDPERTFLFRDAVRCGRVAAPEGGR
jgi:glycerol transport system ATP-binding protein